MTGSSSLSIVLLLLLLLLITVPPSAPFSVVVTGASGFLGTEIVHQLVEAGHEVVAVSRELGRADHLRGLSSSRCRVVECDLATDGSGFASMVESCGCEYIINTAAVFRKECVSYEEELVLPTLAIVEHLVAAAAAASTVRRIVHTSSMAGVRDPRQAPANGRFYTAELDWNSVSARDGPWPEP